MYRPFRAKNIIKSLSQGCRPGLYSVSPSGFTSTYRNFNLVVAIHELPLHTVTKAFSTANVFKILNYYENLSITNHYPLLISF